MIQFWTPQTPNLKGYCEPNVSIAVAIHASHGPILSTSRISIGGVLTSRRYNSPLSPHSTVFQAFIDAFLIWPLMFADIPRMGFGMFARAISTAVQGIDASIVEVEVDVGFGDTRPIIVRLPDAAVRESIDRVSAAMHNSGFRWPLGRTTINLAPADIRKEGPSFDLPIALGILGASDQSEPGFMEDYAIVGELALTGAVRPVKGALPIAIRKRAAGKRGVLVPAENASEAAVVQGLEVIPIQNLRETALFLAHQIQLETHRVGIT